MALAHPLHRIDNRSRNKPRNPWAGWRVSSWWPLFPSRSSVLIYLYLSIRMHSLYEFCYRTYIYIHKECRSVSAKLHPITVYRTLFFFFFFFLGGGGGAIFIIMIIIIIIIIIIIFYFLFLFFFLGGGRSWVECYFSLILGCLWLWYLF